MENPMQVVTGAMLRLATFQGSHPQLWVPALHAANEYAKIDWSEITDESEQLQKHLEACQALAKKHGMPPTLVEEIVDAIGDIVRALE